MEIVFRILHRDQIGGFREAINLMNIEITYKGRTYQYQTPISQEDNHMYGNLDLIFQRAKNYIEQMINDKPSLKTSKEYEEEIRNLKEELELSNNEIQYLESENDELVERLSDE